MTKKNSFGCGMLVMGMIAAGTCSLYDDALRKGYNARIRRVESAQVCHEQLAPLRRKFKENCEGKLYDNVDQSLLETITAERNKIQKELGCEKEKWICRPVDQYHVQESKTEAVYKLE